MKAINTVFSSGPGGPGNGKTCFGAPGCQRARPAPQVGRRPRTTLAGVHAAGGRASARTFAALRGGSRISRHVFCMEGAAKQRCTDTPLAQGQVEHEEGRRVGSVTQLSGGFICPSGPISRTSGSSPPFFSRSPAYKRQGTLGGAKRSPVRRVPETGIGAHRHKIFF